MTLILQTQGLVLADSCRATVNGREYSSGKIFPYGKPVQMRSRRLKFKDWFFGYAGTGDDEVVKEAGESALSGVLDLWWDRYKNIDEMRFINDITSFHLYLFGLEGTVLLSVNSGNVSMEYFPHHDLNQLAIGSGTDAVKRILKETEYNACPVRLMYGTFAMEPTVGGEVEVWRLPLSRHGKNNGLIKIGQYPHKSLLDSFKMLAAPNKLHHEKESVEWLLSVIRRLAKRSPTIVVDLLSQKSLKRWTSLLSKSLALKPELTSPVSRKSTPSPSTPISRRSRSKS